MRKKILITIFIISAIFIAIGLSSCINPPADGGDGGDDGDLYYVSGRVTGAGEGISSVSIQLINNDTSDTLNTSTDPDGFYLFEVPNGSYTIDPESSVYTFTPETIDVTVDGANVTGQDFTATGGGIIETYTISGQVTEAGTGIGYVAISLTGDSTGYTSTATDGNFSIEVEPGSYTIAPTKAGYTIDAPVSQDVTVTDSDVTGVNFTATSDGTDYLYISTIQGVKHTSPFFGQNVTNVYGVVTAIESYTSSGNQKAFYLQTPDADIDGLDITSEGIYVYSDTAVNIGDLVTLDAEVDEYGTSFDWLPLTELKNVTNLTTLSTGEPLPTPITLGDGGRAIPDTDIYNGDYPTADISNDTLKDPATEGISFYESLEGMLVTVNSPKVLGTSHTLFNEFYVVADDGDNSNSVTPRGGVYIYEYDDANDKVDFNPERILIDYAEQSTSVYNQGTDYSVTLGDTFDGPINGVLGYSDSFTTFLGYGSGGHYKIFPTEALPSYTTANLPKETSSLTGDNDTLTVASFNVENFYDGDPSDKINDLASTLVDALNSPYIVGLSEIMDNDGDADTTVTDATESYQTLINAIETNGGPTDYAWFDIAPADDQDGGIPGGNIRVGFIYRETKVTFNPVAGGDATTAVSVNDNSGTPELSFNPGRIEPTDSAWDSSRKPLAAEFEFNGEKVFAVQCHFNSKRGDGSLWGYNQPPEFASEVQRVQQATLVNSFVNDILDINSDANVIVLGDLNDFEFSTPIETLMGENTNQVLYDLATELLPENERYSYIYNGNCQSLDHILVSSKLLTTAQFDIVHRYSEYEYSSRHSDHDPDLASFDIAAGPDNTPPSWTSGYPNLGDVDGGTGDANLYLQINETGTAYYDVSTTSGDYTDPANLISSGTSVALTGSVEAIEGISLTTGSVNYVYVVAQDDESTPNVMTTVTELTIDLSDSTAPSWENGTPTAGTPTSSSVDVDVDVDESATIYYVTIPNGDTAPTSEEIIGSTYGGTIVDSGSTAVTTPDFSDVITVSGLSPSTFYDLYFVAEDTIGNYNASPQSITNVETAAPGNTLFFSDYGEGSSYNKYLEIYNDTGSSVTLRSDTTHYYFTIKVANPTGSETWADGTVYQFNDGASIPNGGVYGLYNSSADPSITGNGDESNGVASFNGDDPVALVKDENNDGDYQAGTDTILDVIGDFSGSDWAKDTGLMRNPDIHTGNGDTYDTGQWTSYDLATVNAGTNFGNHTISKAYVLGQWVYFQE
jgi:uncharacterized protein